jgi:hypothetical protein
MNTGRSRSVPAYPSAVILNVRRTRTTWSIHAFSADGTVKLCMGVPINGHQQAFGDGPPLAKGDITDVG